MTSVRVSEQASDVAKEVVVELTEQLEALTSLRYEENPAQGIVLAVTHLSGGVGKTVTTFNVGYYLAKKGKRVCLIDLDPQSDLSTRVDVAPRYPCLARVLAEGEGVPKPVAISWGGVTLWLLPSTLEGMAAVELNLFTHKKSEERLSRALRQLTKMFDYIVIDCPPNLSLVSENGIVATSGIIGGLIIPVQAQDKAYRALLSTLKSLARLDKDFPLCIIGILATMTANSGMEKEIKELVTSEFGNLAFKTSIPKRVRVAVDGRYQAPIGYYDPNNDGAVAYDHLADEVIARTLSDEDGNPPSMFRLLERETSTLFEAYAAMRVADYGEVDEEGVVDRG